MSLADPAHRLKEYPKMKEALHKRIKDVLGDIWQVTSDSWEPIVTIEAGEKRLQWTLSNLNSGEKPPVGYHRHIIVINNVHRKMVHNTESGHPGSMTFFENGEVARVAYCKEGITQDIAKNIPAEISYYPGGKVASVTWCDCRATARDSEYGHPAHIVFTEEGEVQSAYSTRDTFPARQILSKEVAVERIASANLKMVSDLCDPVPEVVALSGVSRNSEVKRVPHRPIR